MKPFREPFHITDASPEDFEDIHKLLSSGKSLYFGAPRRKAKTTEAFFNCNNYITHRLLVHISDTDPTTIGYAEVSNSPRIPALPEDCWMDWLTHHYCTQLPLSRGNTFFFNTFIYNKQYNPDLVRQVLCEIFYRENKIRYVIVVQCPEYPVRNVKDRPDFYCLEQFSTIYYPFCFSAISCPNPPQIHVIQRDCIIPKMRYRRALPEDNDDIVELVDIDRPDIRQQLGEYYIAEELLSESSNSVLIVTEIFHTTAGFIWLNGHVDILPLVENYELAIFGNLIKFNASEKFKEKNFAVTTARRRPINSLFTIQDIDATLENLAQVKTKESISSDDENPETEVVKQRQLFFKKLAKFVERMKTYDYYIQLRKGRYVIYYNVPEDQTPSAIESQSNVFVIQLFGLIGSHDLRRLFRYLFTAFAAFPDRDYCLISVSVAQTMTPLLFEMLKYFILVPPRPGCKSDEQLYITHRSAIYGDLTLYPVQPEDIGDIKQLLSKESFKTMYTPQRTRRTTRMTTIASRMSVATCAANPSTVATESNAQTDYDLQVVMSILEDIFKDPFSKYKCFTIKCGDSTRHRDDNVTVGFVILRPFTSSWHLEKHFLLTSKNEGPTVNVAELMILKLHPLFHYQADVVFRELARLSNCWHFYHFRPTLHHSLSNDLLMNMQPLEPRRIKKLWFCKSHESLDKPCSGREHTSRATFQSCSLHDVHIHPIDFFQDHFAAFQNNLCHSAYFGHTMNIVILGFTDICKAFLRLLLFSWHGMGNVAATSNCLPHVMITVICSAGIMEAEYESSFRCATCEKDEECWVNFRNCDAFLRDVTERMDVRSWVRFVSGKVKAVDTDNHLVKLESNCEIYYETLLLMCQTDYGVPAGILHDVDRPPANYVHINNRFDKLLCYHKLRIYQQDFRSQSSQQYSIVVYGQHVRAFEFINFLLKHGVQATAISLVMPHELMPAGLMLNDSSIDTRIEPILRQMIEDLGVKVYENMNLLEITRYRGNEGHIESVAFKSFLGEQSLTLACDFFVSYCEKYIADGVLKVLEEANLYTEGSYVLVNENFQTSHPCIYAMGNFIKHRSQPNHQYRFVSPQEAAEKLIHILGLNESQEVHPKEEKFSKPYFFQAQLPMNHYIFKVTSPKRYLANHLDNEYGFPLVTYHDGDFSRVRLNEHGMVEEIVVVTKKNKDYDFLKFFCGRHELLLNNLKSRWYLGDIESFVDFFQQPWVELIMNDHFEELQMLNKLLILPTAHEVMKMNTDRASRLKIMHNYGQDLGVTSQLEFAFLQFIREHRAEFNADIALPEDFPTPKPALDYE